MKWYINALKNYNNYHGRASRKEVIWVNLINTVIIVILYLVESTAGWFEDSYYIFLVHLSGYGIIELIYTFAMLCPIICVNIRRLHDVDKSGKYYWLCGIPIANIYLWYLIFIKKGTAGKNKYGYPSGYNSIDDEPKQNDEPRYRYTITNSPIKTMYTNNPEEYEDIWQYKKVGEEVKEETLAAGKEEIKNIEVLVVKENHETMSEIEDEEMFDESDLPNNTEAYAAVIGKMPAEMLSEKTEQAEKPAPKYCRKCGKHLMEDSNFCRFCGTKVEI